MYVEFLYKSVSHYVYYTWQLVRRGGMGVSVHVYSKIGIGCFLLEVWLVSGVQQCERDSYCERIVVVSCSYLMHGAADRIIKSVTN